MFKCFASASESVSSEIVPRYEATHTIQQVCVGYADGSSSKNTENQNKFIYKFRIKYDCNVGAVLYYKIAKQNDVGDKTWMPTVVHIDGTANLEIGFTEEDNAMFHSLHYRIFESHKYIKFLETKCFTKS